MKTVFGVKYFAIGILVLGLLCSCSKSDSNPVTPTPTPKPDTLTAGWSKVFVATDDLSDVAFANSTTGYTSSQLQIYKTTDGGASWSKLPKKFQQIINIAVTNDGKIFAVGSQDSIFRSNDGGANFTYVATGRGQLTDIFFLDNNTGYVPYNNGLLQTVDGGVTWTSVTPVTGLNVFAQYKSAFFLSSSTGWISSGDDIYKTGGNINNWAKSSFTGTAPSGGFTSLFGISSTIIYAGSGNGGVYKSVDGGSNFSVIATFSSSNIPYLDLHFIDASIGYACCSHRIYKTVNGGNSWTPVVSLGEGNIVEIHFVDANHGWACVGGGSILKLN